ncbi:MAG TPA: hypothetical protein VK729_11340 [Silvibacterium sp.]|nr:hypothetical protein [Silvibacterium sp.]
MLQANNVARITSEFHAAIRNLSGNLIAYVEAICVVGFLVMAILQSAKDLTPARAWFNRSWLRAWLFEKAGVVIFDEKPESSPGIQNMMSEVPKPDRSTALKQFVDAAEESILRTATAGDARAFYQMQLEQLCGQLNAVAQAALGTPKLYWEFVTLFGSLAGSADLKSVRAGEDRDSSYPDALGRVAQSMQRSIDAIQIAAGASWKRYLRWTALILSYAILSAAAWLNSLSTSSMWWFLVMLTSGWFAGVNIAGSIRPKDLHARDREIPWKEPAESMDSLLVWAFLLVIAYQGGLRGHPMFAGSPSQLKTWLCWLFYLGIAGAGVALVFNLRKKLTPDLEENDSARWVVSLSVCWLLLVVASFKLGSAQRIEQEIWSRFLIVLAGSWISGFVASLARDLVVGLQKFRD